MSRHRRQIVCVVLTVLPGLIVLCLLETAHPAAAQNNAGTVTVVITVHALITSKHLASSLYM